MPDGTIQPRILRLRDAPRYCGVDKNRFNAEFRPFLTEIPIGTQGVGFDRVEIDMLLDDYIASRGKRPAGKEENKPWRGVRASRVFRCAGGLAHRQDHQRKTNLRKLWNE